MSKPKAIAATTAALWFCESGHLHIVLMDEDGDEIAGTALEMEDGMEAIADLLVDLDEDHGITLHSIVSEDDEDDDDPIGPTVGSC
jgi:hypothetical protein